MVELSVGEMGTAVTDVAGSGLAAPPTAEPLVDRSPADELCELNVGRTGSPRSGPAGTARGAGVERGGGLDVAAGAARSDRSETASPAPAPASGRPGCEP